MLIALFSLGDHVLFDYITSEALISMLSLKYGYEKYANFKHLLHDYFLFDHRNFLWANSSNRVWKEVKASFHSKHWLKSYSHSKVVQIGEILLARIFARI